MECCLWQKRAGDDDDPIGEAGAARTDALGWSRLPSLCGSHEPIFFISTRRMLPRSNRDGRIISMQSSNQCSSRTMFNVREKDSTSKIGIAFTSVFVVTRSPASGLSRHVNHIRHDNNTATKACNCKPYHHAARRACTRGSGSRRTREQQAGARMFLSQNDWLASLPWSQCRRFRSSAANLTRDMSLGTNCAT